MIDCANIAFKYLFKCNVSAFIYYIKSFQMP